MGPPVSFASFRGAEGLRGEGPEGDPWESRKANWAHLLYR
jgi:hypothetical protein